MIDGSEKRDRQLAFELQNSHVCENRSNVSCILQKDLFIGRVKFGEKILQTKLLSRLSHKVCRLLSSPVLLRKFTNYIVCTYAC